MQSIKSDCACGEGRLPATAPLTSPYVPYQLENPPKYELRKALVRGTLFPGLDLPFMGLVNKTEQPVTPLTELQTMSFAIQEIVLYLDTHRDDAEAMELYRQLQDLYRKGVKIYEEKYGPLTHMSADITTYSWLDDPWPWEYIKNQEV